MKGQRKVIFNFWRVTASFVIIGVMAIVYGCGGGGDSSGGPVAPTILSGSFIDSPVAGVEYETNTQSGITDSQGTFKYQSGETVSFYVGNVFLGSAQGKEVITPIDLVEGATVVYDPVVTNIARFLQSLDDDENPENGISISEDTINSLLERDINLASPELDFDNNVEIHNLLSEIGNIPVSAFEAQQHLLEFVVVGTQCVDISGEWEISNSIPADNWENSDQLILAKENGCDFTGYADWDTSQDWPVFFSINGTLVEFLWKTSEEETINASGTIIDDTVQGSYTVTGGPDDGEVGQWKARKGIFGDGGDVDNDDDGYTENEGDCNDDSPLINPNAEEICGDGIDQDCNGSDLNCNNGASIVGTWNLSTVNGQTIAPGVFLRWTFTDSTVTIRSDLDCVEVFTYNTTGGVLSATSVISQVGNECDDEDDGEGGELGPFSVLGNTLTLFIEDPELDPPTATFVFTR